MSHIEKRIIEVVDTIEQLDSLHGSFIVNEAMIRRNLKIGVKK